MAMPEMAADALWANAAHQGRRIDDWRDEEPGKMTHQASHAPLSAIGQNPFLAYYGDYATPQDFLILLGQHLVWSGDAATTRSLLPAARRALDWLDRYGDQDGDGFLEYQVRSEQGPKNQGWKDADNAIVDEHGEIVDDPIAPCEIQGYWYIALKQCGVAMLRTGDRLRGMRLLHEAERLQRHFDEAYWMPGESFYAMALGPDKQQIRSVSSNVGHLLSTGIVPRERAPEVTSRLLEPDMFSGWGVRTLSSDHPAFNPFSYHLGSVWPVENATFLLGFARYGQWEALHRVAKAMLDSTELFIANRLPEAIDGVARDEEHPHPGIYPQSNEPQAWSASAIVLLVQALLGIHPFAPGRTLLVDPHLPGWLPDVRLEGLRVGDALVDLHAWRRGNDRTRLRSDVRTGRLLVRRQPMPQQPMPTPLRGLVAAVERRIQ